MNTKQILSYIYLIGQILELIGVWLLYKYGISKWTPNTPQGYSFPTINPEWEKDNKKYKRLSKLGIRFILLGVSCQLPVCIFNCYTKE